jgi:predicted RNase H-like nuclease
MGVDMPIGLGDAAPRVCDIEARKFLGRSRSSVFPAPPRAILGCEDYRTALDIARSTTGRGISKQSFNITAKVAELDRLVQSRTACEIVEVHPECSFLTLNSPRGAASDDVLDAYAVLWSTMRFRSGEHREFGDGRLDNCGIPMRIVC